MIRENKIDIDWKQNQKLSLSSSNSQSNNSTTLVIEPQVQTQVNADPLSEFTVEPKSPIVSQTSETKSSNDVPGFNLDVPIDADEWVTPS